MKSEIFYNKKIILAGSSIGVLLFSSQASAQIINWAPVMVQVPLSATAMIILGILLFALGTFVAPRMRRGHKGTFVITAALAGILALSAGGKIIEEARAVAVPNGIGLLITTATGPIGGMHLEPNRETLVTNDPDNVPVEITVLDPQQCIFSPVMNECMTNQVLQPGDSCHVAVVCDTMMEYPESDQM